MSTLGGCGGPLEKDRERDIKNTHKQGNNNIVLILLYIYLLYLLPPGSNFKHLKHQRTDTFIFLSTYLNVAAAASISIIASVLPLLSSLFLWHHHFNHFPHTSFTVSFVPCLLPYIYHHTTVNVSSLAIIMTLRYFPGCTAITTAATIISAFLPLTNLPVHTSTAVYIPLTLPPISIQNTQHYRIHCPLVATTVFIFPAPPPKISSLYLSPLHNPWSSVTLSILYPLPPYPYSLLHSCCIHHICTISAALII